CSSAPEFLRPSTGCRRETHWETGLTSRLPSSTRCRHSRERKGSPQVQHRTGESLALPTTRSVVSPCRYYLHRIRRRLSCSKTDARSLQIEIINVHGISHLHIANPAGTICNINQNCKVRLMMRVSRHNPRAHS